jgi:hypothetical protein
MRLGPDDRDDLQNRWKPSIQHDEEQAIPLRELHATAHPPLQHDHLMSECCVLCLKSVLHERQSDSVTQKQISAIIATEV